MNVLEFDIALVTLAVWPLNPAGLDAMVGAAQAIRNRTRLLRLSWQEAVVEIHTNQLPDTRDPRFQTLLNRVEEIVRGSDRPSGDLVNGGCFWLSGAGEPGELADRKVTATVGTVQFYI